MCMRIIIIIIMIALGGSVSAFAQWTLDDCITYAQEHNIQLKKQANAIESQKLSVENAKYQRLPDLNASASENFSFGRGLTSDNTYTNKSTSSTGFYLNTSVPLFTGMRITNEVKMQKLNLQAAVADLEKAREDIALSVAQYYIQAVYGNELRGIAQRQIAIDSMQRERIAAMVECGKASRAELAQQEAALAQSRLTATQADNDYSIALLNLSQLLELPTPEGFAIAMPAERDMEKVIAPLPSPEDIFGKALLVRPSISAAKIRIDGAERSISVAKSALYPQLSLSGSLGTSYYKTAGEYAESFGTQLKNKFSQGIGINLSIPLFNRFQTRNNIRAARIEHSNRMLDLDEKKKALYKEIQTVYYNTVAAESKYRSSMASLKSSEEAYTLMREKYENGKANITEFNEAKNNMLKAESDLMRAKYEYMYQKSLVDFYSGEQLRI